MIIARYEAPKQRMTRHYGYVLIEDAGVENKDRFHVLKIDLDDGATIGGDYGLTAAFAWEAFHNKIKENAEYGPGTWE